MVVVLWREGRSRSSTFCLSVQIIPPPEWCPRRSYADIGSTVISTPVSQFVSGQQGIYQLYNIQKKALTYEEFAAKAVTDQ